MALPISLVSILAFTFLSPFWSSTVFTESKTSNFLFHGFNGTEIEIELVEATVLKPSGALRLTNNSQDVIGHAFFSSPLQMWNTTAPIAATPKISSFSTCFVFQFVPAHNNPGGYGLAFTLSPSPRFVGGQGRHYLGVLNESNNGSSSNHIFMVEFDTVNGFSEDSDTKGNHVGININSMQSTVLEPASYHKSGSEAKEEVSLDKEPIQAWIDYDGPNKVLNVTIAPFNVPKPSRPLIEKVIDLSQVMKEEMYAGFSAATGQKRSAHYILGWSFRLNGIADSINSSKLHVVSDETKPSPKNPHLREAFIATFSVVLFFLVVALSFLIYRKKIQFEVLEDWELDCPRRLSYRDLYSATKGFKRSELIGSGGFGEVYKGVLRGCTGAEVAVKRISNNSLQGIREFAAEIESLGRLRHKNLVNLQGWCKHKNDLLLVYDYVRNGSLDRLIHSPENEISLTWEQRLSIIKGIASGLLYLHEEWEQVVIHRDVKSSNVLIDGDMNGRLGDFGLARLYDRSKHSYTTNVVGTVGYIAPELTTTGKASTSSDVFAYGVLLLEIACGKTPILYDPIRGHLTLVAWVIECLQSGKILDAVDPKLNNNYVVEEIELVLGLGLLCSQYRQEARPTMRQVMRYLNRDDLHLDIDELRSAIDSGRTSEIRSGFLGFLSSEIPNTSASFEVISRGAIPVSYRSSSTWGNMSSSSFSSGR